MKTATIEKWVMKRLLQWVERAYRRGYQHGVLAGQNGFKHNSKEVINYRFPANGVRFATWAATQKGEVFEYKCGDTLEDKHLIGGGGDTIPYIKATKKGDKYILTGE